MKNIGIAYFDCFSGISGDMVLGALVDAGADLGALEAELRKLKLPGWSISAQNVQRRSIHATLVKVETEHRDQHHPASHSHRGLAEIVKMIEAAGLAPRAAERAKKIFRRLGEAEAHVAAAPLRGAALDVADLPDAAVVFDDVALLDVVSLHSSLPLSRWRERAWVRVVGSRLKPRLQEQHHFGAKRVAPSRRMVSPFK